jgi:hypothetical protein
MKPTSVRRGIQSRHSRSAGDDPRIGRVSRLRDADGPKNLGWTSKRGAGAIRSAEQIQARRRMVWMWSVVLTVATSLVICGFMAFWLRTHGHRGQVGGESNMLHNVRIESRFKSPNEADALDLVKRALSNRDPELVETCFRTGSAKPDEVISFLNRSIATEGEADQLTWLSSMDVDGLLLEGVLVTFEESRKATPRLAMLVPNDKGAWKVDFDAFARTCSPDLTAILGGSAERSEVRVWISRDYYFNGSVFEENEWDCYLMNSPEINSMIPDESLLLRGYCKKGSPQANALERIFAAGGKAYRATLEVSKREGAEKQQLQITRVWSEDWVKPEVAFDERFD